MHILQAENVTKEIKGRLVLDRLAFSAEGGRVYGIAGKAGSGKTTLLQVLSGVVRLSEGRVLLDGTDYYSAENREEEGRKGEQNSRDDRRKRDGFPGIGVIIENSSLYPQLSGFQNLKFLAQMRGVIGDEEIKEAIAAMGLDPDDKRPFRKYSLEMKQRLLMAQAVMEEPAFLFLDEPVNAMDAEGIRLVREQLSRTAGRGAVILLASRSREDIQLLCDEIYWLQDGKIMEK